VAFDDEFNPLFENILLFVENILLVLDENNPELLDDANNPVPLLL
jgi:hypothetical protein